MGRASYAVHRHVILAHDLNSGERVEVVELAEAAVARSVARALGTPIVATVFVWSTVRGTPDAVAAQLADGGLDDGEAAIDEAEEGLEDGPEGDWTQVARGVLRVEIYDDLDSDGGDDDDAVAGQ